MPVRTLWRRLHYLLNRERLDQELADEMAAHRAMAAGKGAGRFGNTLRLREEARDAWGWTWIDRLGQDLRYAARGLRNSPGFTLTAVLMLGLGIGVNVAAFGFFNLMVLRPLPVRDPASLLHFLRRSRDNFADNFPYAEVAFYREHSKALSAVLALNFSKVAIDGDDKPLAAHFVTADLFRELGAEARLGRLLDPARDGTTDAEPVVVLGHGFWQRHFGADPWVVGRTLRLNGKPATVIGVASSEFSGLGMDVPDVWLPMSQQPYFFGGGQTLSKLGEGSLSVFMWGRLKPGLAPKAAEDDLRSLAAELRRQHPNDIWEGETLPSEPGGYASRVAPPMYPVLALVGVLCLLILAVACGNLGSLLLARGVARDREIAIRAAVGAGRGRLVRQLFTESLLLAVLGSVAGLGLGFIALRSLMVWTAKPSWLSPTPDWRVVAFASGIGFASAILFGLAPAWQMARQRHRTMIVRKILIGAQVAASCVLLIVAGLLVRALHRATSAPSGFDYGHVISVDPGLWSRGYTPEGAKGYLEALESQLRALPGVESMSIATNPPLGNRWSVHKAEIGGRMVGVHVNAIDPAFFETMTIPMLRGRTLARGEASTIVVSESLARLQWPEEDPLGKTFRMGTDAPATVVGVAGSARLVSPEDSDAVELYGLAEAPVLPSVVVLVKTSVPPESVLPSVAAVARALDPKLFPELQLMKAAFRQKIETSEYAALSAGLLGLLALVIACVGIVGLVAYAVSQRTREIGVRMALGAPSAHVLSVVLRQLSRPVGAGLVVGVGGAAALSQVLRGVLYGVSHVDPAAYLAAISVFVVVVGAAAVWPARRALRVDPTVALRSE
jgi:predicted permease